MGSSIFPIMSPGITAGKTASHRVVFRQRDESYLANGKTIDGSKSRDPSNTSDVTVLQSGLLMGKITSGGKYAPSILGLTSGALAAGATSITTATAAVLTELVRRIGATGTFTLTGPPSANGVVNSEVVTYSAATGTTITCTAILGNYISGSFIQPTDGSQQPLSFIDDLVLSGYQVVDNNGANVSSVDWPRVPISGTVHSANLINWPTDTSLQQWIISRLNDIAGRQFNFDHVL